MRELSSIIILVGIFIVSISSLIFNFVGVFAGPTSILALSIIRTSHLERSNILPEGYVVPYWSSALQYELNYPVPSLILAVLSLVSGLPTSILPFIPILVFVSVLLYSTLYQILINEGISKNLAKFVSSFFFLFFVIDSMAVMYIGRAALGNILFLIILCIIITRLNHIRREDVIVLFVFSVMIANTYYTGSLNVMLIILMLALLSIFSSSSHVTIKGVGKNLLVNIFPMFLISSFGILKLALISIIGNFSLESLTRNVITLARVYLSSEKVAVSPATYFIQENPFIMIFKNTTRFLKVISILTMTFFVISNVIRKGEKSLNNRIWVLSVLLLSTDLLASAVYMIFTTPSIILSNSLRLGPLIFSYIIAYTIEKYDSIRKKQKELLILKALFVILISMSILGDIMYCYSYGNAAAKPLGFHKIESISDFIKLQDIHYPPQFIAGDAYYSTFLLYRTYEKISNSLKISIFFIPLRADAVTLVNNLRLNRLEHIPYIIHNRGYSGLLLNTSDEIVWGDGSGYVVEINKNYLYDLLTKSDADILYSNTFVLLIWR